MRVTAPAATARVGLVEVRGVQRVVELEALETPARPPPAAGATQAVAPSAIHAIQARTAVVVPCKDEALAHIQGVWAAIPASSLIVLVSGSDAAHYAVERAALAAFCAATGRRAEAVHQRAPAVARAVRAAGMPQLLDAADGLVYKGKGEGLVLGIALAATARGPAPAPAPGYYRYIGFVDADNFVPGSVHEYCRAFSAGMHLAQAADAMVRINWSSKPKVEAGQLRFKPSGRSSEIVNRWLNRLLANMDAIITPADGPAADAAAAAGLICTGNAGEHAMTVSLALKLRVASGYAIEPFHFLDIFERLAGRVDAAADELPMSPEASLVGSPVPTSPTLGASDKPGGPLPPLERLPAPLARGLTPPASPTAPAAPAKVQILQIRTLNPHFHDNKGEAHVVHMWKQGLSAIYHSAVAAAFTQYREQLRVATFGDGERDAVPTPPFSASASVATSPSASGDDAAGGPDAVALAAAHWEPAKCRIYPSPGCMDLWALRAHLEKGEGGFWWSGMADEAAAAAPVESGLGMAALGLGPRDADARSACVDERAL